MADGLAAMDADVKALEQQMEAEPPAPAPEPEPQQQPADQAPQEPAPIEPTPSGYVRQEALHAERQERKELQRQLEEQRREYDRNLAVMQDRLQRIDERFAQQPPPKPEPLDPDPEIDAAIRAGKPQVSFDEDPEKYFKQRDAIDARRDQMLAQMVDGHQRQAIQQYHQQGLVNQIRSREFEFARSHPDYQDALQHLRQDRVAEFMAVGLDFNQALQATNNDELAVAQFALQTGRDPAEVAYTLAQRRGYKSSSAEAQPSSAAPAVSGPSAAASSSGSPPSMERLVAGQREAQTVGAINGGAGGRLTPDALVKMSEKEFETWLSKATPEQQREMMGA